MNHIGKSTYHLTIFHRFFSTTQYFTIWMLVYVGIFAIGINDLMEILILKRKSRNAELKKTEENTISNSHSDKIFDLQLP